MTTFQHSTGSLINLTQLSHIIRNADTVFWNYDAESDMHWIATPTFVLHVSIDKRAKTREVLMKRFNDAFPLNHTLKSVQARKRYEVSEQDFPWVNTYKAIYDADVELFDTYLCWDKSDGELHVYYAETGRERSYILIAQKYSALLDMPERMYAKDPKRNSPIIFHGLMHEFLIILPVVCEPSVFLAKLN